MQIKEIIIRTLLAVVFGAIIGREREIHNRPAGMRTHALVCLGSAVIAMIQVELVEHAYQMVKLYPEMKGVITVNAGRVVAQVVSGIGFLGAGTILITKDKIKGLTTAASLWVVSCVGIAIGYGYYNIAIVSGITVPMVLVGLRKIERRITKRSHHANLLITFKDNENHAGDILSCFKDCGIHVKGLKTEDKDKNSISFMLYSRHFKNWDSFMDELSELDYIEEIERRK